jgi:ribosomal protein S27AE
MGLGDDTEQYDSALASCEETAGNQGHTLGVWYQVDETLYASICARCGAMVWLARQGQEKRWRIGGKALEEECLQEDRGLLGSGA